MVLSVALGTGCATNGRSLLLKEYGPSIQADVSGPLKGATIWLKGFTTSQNLVMGELPGKPEEPAQFKYQPMSHDQDRQWTTEMNAMRKQAHRPDWREIGNLRNGFGMVMSHVYAMNEPAAWLAEGLKYDLEAQGARVLDSAQPAGADAVVSGNIQLCRADMYMVIDASIVVDVEIQSKSGQTRHRQIHTHGATAAMMASEGEYFHALRDARQKLSVILSQEIANSLKQ